MLDQPGGWRGRREILETIRRLAAGRDPSTVLGVGIGIPGIYDYRSHSIVIAESLGLQSFSTRTLEETIGFPVKVINRANAAALGEKRYGLGRRVSSMIFVSVGGGIGAGIILDGRLLMGSTGSAGEIGHSVILPHGPVCRCGSSGCLESLVSSDLLLARARELVRKVPGCLLRRRLREESDPITLPMIEEAAREGDEHILRLLERYGEYIGLALANAVNLFDSQLVVIGGEMGTMFGQFLLPAVTRTIRLHARYFREVEVAVSQLGRLAVAVGASAFLV